MAQCENAGKENEADKLEREIADLQHEEEKLSLECTEYSFRELQIRFLLELLDEMQLDDDEREQPELHGACYDYEDFFRWTKHPLPDGLILNGQITRFDNDMVIRYLDTATVTETGFEVKFKAGITIKV